jgi:hypothetical protein
MEMTPTLHKALTVALLIGLPGPGARAQAIVHGKWFQPLNLSVAMADAIAVLGVAGRSSRAVRTEVLETVKGSFGGTSFDGSR